MFGIYPKSYQEIIQIIKKYPSIEKVVIYGSRAKGTAREGSDIDITLFGSVTDKELSNLRNDFDDSYIPYLFDVSIYEQLQSESLKEHINRVGKVFYQKK